jgi:SAM-dependent methyltransferase
MAQTARPPRWQVRIGQGPIGGAIRKLKAAVSSRILRRGTVTLRQDGAPSPFVLGEDIDAETLDLVIRVAHQGEEVPGMSEHQRAQLYELSFWRYVAIHGYTTTPAIDFPKMQGDMMISCFNRTGWSLADLKSAAIVEIGSGPLGMIEYLPGRRKEAFDPLIPHYQKLFHKAQSGQVRYHSDLDQLLARGKGQFDLGICFNVLDHTTDPRGLLAAYMSLIKQGGRFLFQVNTVGGPRSELHGRMHPSPLSPGTVRAWIGEYSSDFREYFKEERTEENEHFFMLWGHKNRGSRAA